MLRNLGHSVQILCDGAQAVQTDLSEFDVVLMDIQMPVMDGLEATKQIRSMQSLQGTRRLPIVALTASALHEQRQACLDADMDGVITKPVTRKSLAEALASIVPMSRPDRG
jgi:CheY-like chemotaxis protein